MPNYIAKLSLNIQSVEHTVLLITCLCMLCFKKFSKAQKNIALGAIVFSFLVHSFTSTCDFLTANSTLLALGVLVGKVLP